MIRTYSELVLRPTFEERFRYLALNGVAFDETFASKRYLNQAFYKSDAWSYIRDFVIIRDNGCDLGDPDRPSTGRVLVHHMNPITVRQVLERDPVILDPEYLITVTHRTHNAIHYGDETQLLRLPPERRPNDTIPWR